MKNGKGVTVGSRYKLFEEIIALSESDVWEEAVKEWDLVNTYIIDNDNEDENDEGETCLCGHYPIFEVCEIANKLNGASAIVGNCCVKKFMDNESDQIFKAIKRVSDNIAKSLNFATIRFAYEKRVINDWEYKFYLSIMDKRKLSIKQGRYKRGINDKVLKHFRKTNGSNVIKCPVGAV